MEDTATAITAAPGQIGARLKQLRARRGVTLTRNPGGVQAWKINVPASNSEPSPKSETTGRGRASPSEDGPQEGFGGMRMA